MQDNKYSFFKLIRDSQKSNYKFGLLSWFVFIIVCLGSVILAFEYRAKWEFWLCALVLIFELLLVRALYFYDNTVAEIYSFNQTLRAIIGPLNFIGIILFSMFMLDDLYDGFCYGLSGMVAIYAVSIKPLKEGFAPTGVGITPPHPSPPKSDS